MARDAVPATTAAAAAGPGTDAAPTLLPWHSSAGSSARAGCNAAAPRAIHPGTFTAPSGYCFSRGSFFEPPGAWPSRSSPGAGGAARAGSSRDRRAVFFIAALTLGAACHLLHRRHF